MHDEGPGRVGVGRVYDPPAGDGRARVLVDGLWPRGLRREAAELDEWMRPVAPSAELRRWYGHRPDRFAEFRRRYRAELAEPPRREALDRLTELGRDTGLVLLTATRDPALSHAAVLAEFLGEPG